MQLIKLVKLDCWSHLSFIDILAATEYSAIQTSSSLHFGHAGFWTEIARRTFQEDCIQAPLVLAAPARGSSLYCAKGLSETSSIISQIRIYVILSSHLQQGIGCPLYWFDWWNPYQAGVFRLDIHASQWQLFPSPICGTGQLTCCWFSRRHCFIRCKLAH